MLTPCFLFRVKGQDLFFPHLDSSFSEAVDDTLQPRSNLLGYILDIQTTLSTMAMASAGSIGHPHTSLGGFLLDYIAGQKHPDLVLRLQGLIGEGRIPGPEDTVLAGIHIEFFLQGFLSVDFGQHPEALFFQSRGHPLQCFLE